MTQDNCPVAIIGAGVAGLTAAYRLALAGVPSRTFESNHTKIGGRCWSAREFGNGELGEHGGERIDTRHREIIELAVELGLELEDHGAPADTANVVVRSRGRTQSMDEHLAGRAHLKAILETDLRRRGISYGSLPAFTLSDAERELDLLSVRQWVMQTVPGGARSAAGSALLDSFAELHGLEPQHLSAYLLVEDYDSLFAHYLGDVEETDTSRLADERWKILGGNDMLVTALTARLPDGSVEMGRHLSSVVRGASTYRLGFADGSSAVAEHVILALPFSTLKYVDVRRAGFRPDKIAAISEVSYGVCAKLLVQLDRPVTDLGNWSGTYISDRPRFQTFCSNRTTDASIVTVYLGAGDAANFEIDCAHGPAPTDAVDAILEAMERDVHGIQDAYAGVSWLDAWGDDGHVGGAYATLRPGHAARHRHVAGRPERNVSFAGEHTSILHRGFLNGAVESGMRAAEEVLSRRQR